jgi:uncharacterized protein involved in type VI secretion and phage assembly
MPLAGTSHERALVDLMRERDTRFWGKYRGTVDDVNDNAFDGKTLGRIVAMVPDVYGDTVKSPWAWPCVPFAGKNHGLVLLPEKGDKVWIEFEMGNPEHPIWTGCWWGDGDFPTSDAGEKKRTLITSQGHKMILDEDAPSITITHSGGAEITITDNDLTIKQGGSIVVTSSSVKINDTSLEVS